MGPGSSSGVKTPKEASQPHPYTLSPGTTAGCSKECIPARGAGEWAGGGFVPRCAMTEEGDCDKAKQRVREREGVVSDEVGQRPQLRTTPNLKTTQPSTPSKTQQIYQGASRVRIGAPGGTGKRTLDDVEAAETAAASDRVYCRPTW